MLQPTRLKYRNKHRGRMKGIANSGSTLSFGEFGLKATACAWISSRQIEAARRVITRYARRGGKYGFVFSQINLLLRVTQKLEWVKVKVQWIIGLQ